MMLDLTHKLKQKRQALTLSLYENIDFFIIT